MFGHFRPEQKVTRKQRLGVRSGSFSTEAANSAARPTSASPRKPTSGPNEKSVATGQEATSGRYSITSSASTSRLCGMVRRARSPRTPAASRYEQREGAPAGRGKLRRVDLGRRIEGQWTWKSQLLHSRIGPTRRPLRYRCALDKVNRWRLGHAGVQPAQRDHQRKGSDC